MLGATFRKPNLQPSALSTAIIAQLEESIKVARVLNKAGIAGKQTNTQLNVEFWDAFKDGAVPECGHSGFSSPRHLANCAARSIGARGIT
jgi:hypothetical protein